MNPSKKIFQNIKQGIKGPHLLFLFKSCLFKTKYFLEIAERVKTYINSGFKFGTWEVLKTENEVTLVVGGSSELIVFQGGNLNDPSRRSIASDSSTKRDCERAGIANPVHCKNFIQNIFSCGENILFCGTNAFNPRLYTVPINNLANNQTADDGGQEIVNSIPISS